MINLKSKDIADDKLNLTMAAKLLLSGKNISNLS